jgi:endonuclease/exonuclease/phosphatase family metal-dependent hydrolase
MIVRSAALLFFAMSALGQAVEIRVATFNVGARLVVPPGGGAPYFDYGIGAPGQPDHDSVREVLARIDADVVALQEIHTADVTGNDVSELAASLGYAHHHIAPTTNVFDPSLRVAFLSRFPFLTQNSIGPPAGAKDVTRRMPVVKVDVPGTTRDPVLIAAHLKSASEASDLFQRTVEMRRLTDFLNSQGFTPDDNYVVLGDFNLSATDNDRTFTAIPGTGLPSGFILGADVALPVTYYKNPLRYFNGAPVVLLDPRQLDQSPSTIQTGSVLDLLLVSPVLAGRPMRTEVYNSALDGTNSAGLPKAGPPLAAGTSALASDHYPLVVDLELDPTLPYPFTAAGQTVTEDFAEFPGTYDPPSWERSGGNWKGADNGSRAASGFRAYGPAGDPSLGFLPGALPGTATATFTNQSTTVLTALQVSFTAEQWRSHSGGTADTLTAELIAGGAPIPLPQLAFSPANHLATGAISGGTSASRSTTVGGLAVAPGGTFQLRFTFTPGAGGGAAPGDVFVNEFHYDNAGTDVGEFVEIVAGPDFQPKFSEIDVLFYNGSNGEIYHTLNLAGPQFSRTITANAFDIFTADLGATIQNGPDGIALVNRTTNQVIHFLSYEGAFAGTAGSALGVTSTNIGVSQTSTEPVGSNALGLTGSGGVRADFNWAKIAGPYSKGAVNSGQTLVNPALPSQGIAIDNLAVTFLTGGDTDGDGSSDADEAVFGTNPADAGSRFVVSFAYQTPAPGMLRLSFPTQTGRGYVVESCTDFTDWRDEATYPGTGATQVADFPVSPGDPRRFYRVRVTLQ